MKTLKVYDAAHTAVKVFAAQQQRTTTNVASSLLLFVLGKLNDGSLQIAEVPHTEEEDETNTGAEA